MRLTGSLCSGSRMNVTAPPAFTVLPYQNIHTVFERLVAMKKVLAVFLCLLAFVVLLCPGAYAASGDTTVYITRTGERYHDAGCRYLSKSCIEITLQTAVDSGYTPCKVCHPPTLDVAAAFTLPPTRTYAPIPTVSHMPLPSPLPTRMPAQSDTQASVVATADEDDSDNSFTIITVAVIAGAVIYGVYEDRKFKKELARIRSFKFSDSESDSH